jgi:hypothetical protein
MRTRRARARLIGPLAVMVMATIGTGCTVDPPELLTATYELAPFNFEPMGATGDESNSYDVGIPRPPGDIAVKRITWKLVDGAGTEIPATSHDIHFHHVVLFNSGHADHACPSTRSGLGGRFAAPGGERTPLELPNGFAYFSGSRDVWSATWHLMNLSDQPQRNIRVQYTVTWARDRSTLASATPYWLDQAGCGGAGTITVPGGGDPAVYQRERTFTMPRSGVIRAVRSHMHDGGIDVTLFRADGQVICTGTPVYHQPEGGGHEHGGPDEHGHGADAARIVAIPLCTNLDVRINAGDRLRQVVRYDNGLRQTDAMGSNLVYLVEDPLPPAPSTTTTGPMTTIQAPD